MAAVADNARQCINNINIRKKVRMRTDRQANDA